MFEVQAISSECGKMYSIVVKNYREVSECVRQYLGYKGIDTVVVVNVNKKGESYAGERLY